MMVEDDPALPVGERDQPDPDAVAVRYRLLEIGLRGQFVDAPIKRPGGGVRQFGRDRVIGGRRVDGVAHIGQRQRQHLVAQGEV